MNGVMSMLLDVVVVVLLGIVLSIQLCGLGFSEPMVFTIELRRILGLCFFFFSRCTVNRPGLQTKTV